MVKECLYKGNTDAPEQHQCLTDLRSPLPDSDLCAATTLRLLLDSTLRPRLLTLRLRRRLVRATMAWV